MATRRMLSKEVVESSRFLKMPISAQALYFHLVMNTDDEGFVEAYNVMNLIHSNMDDFEVLKGRGYIIALNKDHVTYIIDWLKQNKISAKRKKVSQYRELLIRFMCENGLNSDNQFNAVTFNEEQIGIQLNAYVCKALFGISPVDVQQIANKCQTDDRQIPDNCQQNVGRMSDNCQQNVGRMSDNCQQNAGRMSDNCQQNVGRVSDKCLQNVGRVSDKCLQNVSKLSAQGSVGKGSVGKDSLIEYRVGECSIKSDTLSIDDYNNLIHEFPKELVDSTIQRTKSYKNCTNYETVAQWCRETCERKNHKSNEPKSSLLSSCNHNYDYELLERQMLLSGMLSE